jgi:hypothetical protein
MYLLGCTFFGLFPVSDSRKMAEEQPATKKDTVVFLTEEEASVPSKVQGSSPAAALLLPKFSQVLWIQIRIN